MACRTLTRRQRLVRTRNVLILRMLCATGIRVGELVALRLGDVRQRERTLVIRGKGDRERLDGVPLELARRAVGDIASRQLFPQGQPLDQTRRTIREPNR